MTPFQNLFNGKVTVQNTFQTGFGIAENPSETLKSFLIGVCDKPADFGFATEHQTNAKIIASHFLSHDNEVMPNKDVSAIGDRCIFDLGSGLGALFSLQDAATQEMRSYRPILYAYARYMNAVGTLPSMTAVMQIPGSSKHYFGSTITVKPTDGPQAAKTPKVKIQGQRRKLLQRLLQFHQKLLPALPPTYVRLISWHLAGELVPLEAGVPRQEEINDHLLHLYDTWVLALIKSSNQTIPLELTLSNDKIALANAQQEIKAAETEQYANGVDKILGCKHDWKEYLEHKLEQDSTPQLFGHCAETMIFIELLKEALVDRVKTVGLAVVPGTVRDLTAAEIQQGVNKYDWVAKHCEPCINCVCLISLTGMNRETYDSYYNKDNWNEMA